MRANARRRSAFTLVELLVVIAIISILAAMLLPTLGKAIESAKVLQCTNAHRQAYLCLSTYADENGDFPASVSDDYWSVAAATGATEDIRRNSCAGFANDLSLPPPYDGRSWYSRMLDGGYADDDILCEIEPLPSGYSAKTKRNVEVNGYRRAPYHYHGPGTNSWSAFKFGWSWGMSKSDFKTPCRYATLHPRQHKWAEPHNSGGVSPLLGRDNPDQVLLACPRFRRIDVWPTVQPHFDPHHNLNPAMLGGSGEQDWFPELPVKAITRSYIDGHAKYFRRADQED